MSTVLSNSSIPPLHPTPPLADRHIERSGIREISSRADEIPDVISLALGEPTETAEPHVVEAAARAARDGLTRYTDALGVPEFRRAAADYTRRVKGLRYSPLTETQVIPGATFGLFLAVAAVAGPGDEVIVPSPAFTSYDPQIQLAGATSVHVRLRPEQEMRLDADTIEAAVTPRTRAILINSPSNPIGAVTPREDLERLAEVALRHNLWVISDEVYHSFVFPSTGVGAVAPSIAQVDGMREHTIIVESLSKTFAMTGWRIGYLHGPHPLIDHTATLAELVHSSVNGPAQYAGIAALTGSLQQVGLRRERYARNRDLVLAELASAEQLTPIPPEGAFYAFVGVRPTGLSSHDFSLRLLEEEHVATVPGEAFGPEGAGFVRISYAGDEPALREGLRRMVRFSQAEAAKAGPAARLSA